MSKQNATPRRVRIERNIYRRADGKLEVVYRDSSGVQRYQPIQAGIMAARRWREDTLGRKARGEHVGSNPKLKFGEAADRWLSEQVIDLRPKTQESYRGHVENHLRPRWGNRKLDKITVDHVAQLVRELREAGLAERSIGGVIAVANRIFRFAGRRLGWHGTNPIPLLENGERPSTATGKRRIYQDDELGQVLAAAHGQWRVLFALAAVIGARKSEILGLVWEDVDLRNVDEASVTISHQVDRQGERQELKTENSQRQIEIPRSLAAMLMEHRAQSAFSQPDHFVFCTRTGKAHGQRNAVRALRMAQKAARDNNGRPTFPVLHEKMKRGEMVPAGAVPTFHGFRHSSASHAIAAGESVEEISWMLGHKNSQITRMVYLQEVKSSERRARQRAGMEARYGAMLAGSSVEATDRSKGLQKEGNESAKVVDLQEKRTLG